MGGRGRRNAIDGSGRMEGIDDMIDPGMVGKSALKAGVQMLDQGGLDDPARFSGVDVGADGLQSGIDVVSDVIMLLQILGGLTEFCLER